MFDFLKPAVPDPVEMGSGAIEHLNSIGYRERYKPLDIVDTCREALVKMPNGKHGVVIGSGGNTQLWRDKGWSTLDIDPNVGADLEADANWLTSAINQDSLDYIYVEHVKYDPQGKEGVAHARLLNQCNKVLKPGGKLIIKTAHFENEPEAKTPNRHTFLNLLKDHGFHGIAELEPVHRINEAQYEQVVTYYGEKKRTGVKVSGRITYPQ